MLNVAGCKIAREDSDRFWKEELPLTAIENLLENPREEYLFDEIILDEAQDVIGYECYLNFLEISLRAGLASGRWIFFGDFEKQAIYGKVPADINNIINTRVGQVPMYSLRVNCRNTPRVASVARLLGGLDPDYSRILRPDDNIEPDLRYYSDTNDQRKLLIETLEWLYGEGFYASDIVILSTKMDTSCAASHVETNPWRERLRPLRETQRGHIGYCTIHAFKGMEKPVVIVTDVERLTWPDAESLFYIAVTRALHRLNILAHEATKSEVVSKLMNIPASGGG
jgi:superfamily I DNA/RNA helicase